MRDPTSLWSDQEKQALHHESFVDTILRYRGLIGKVSDRKPFWQRLLESTGGTALITVLVGGLLGQWISWSIQQGLRDREFQESWLKARGDQALIAYKEYVDKEREVVKHAYDLIGSSVSAGEALIDITGPDFAPDYKDRSQREKALVEQRTSYRHDFNVADDQWSKERESLGLLVTYYHQGLPEVMSDWRAEQDSVTNYLRCAEKWYSQYSDKPGRAEDVENACKADKDLVRERLTHLTATLQSTRRYAWEGWESPEKLKADLQKVGNATPTPSPVASPALDRK
jgi:hypothetical protein